MVQDSTEDALDEPPPVDQGAGAQETQFPPDEHEHGTSRSREEPATHAAAVQEDYQHQCEPRAARPCKDQRQERQNQCEIGQTALPEAGCVTAQDDHQRNQGDEISAQLQRMLKHTLDSGQADPALEFRVISQRVEFF